MIPAVLSNVLFDSIFDNVYIHLFFHSVVVHVDVADVIVVHNLTFDFIELHNKMQYKL